MKRTLMGGVTGGVIVFAWGAVAHMLLPVGEMGIRQIPNEDVVLGVMKQSIQEPGFYIFPGMDMSRPPTEAEGKAWEAKVKAGPTGVVVYHPQGQQPLSPRQLLIELASGVLAALVVAFVLSMVVAGFGARVLGVTLLGLFAWLSISVSYWNWYGFPVAFIAGEAVDQVGGWFLAGLAMAAIVKPVKAGQAG